MPTVETRTTTRHFVPKTASKTDGDVGAVAAAAAAAAGGMLRSKRTPPPSRLVGTETHRQRNEWNRRFGGAGGVGESRRWGGEEEDGVGVRSTGAELTRAVFEIGGVGPSRERFGIVYRRNRRRAMADDSALSSSQPGDEDGKEHRYGITFSRRQLRKKLKVSPLVEEALESVKASPLAADILRRAANLQRVGLEITVAASSFAVKVGITEADVWNGSGGRVVLVVLLDSSDGGNLHQFSRFLVTILTAMRRKRLRMLGLASFLLSKNMVSVLSNHGMHFLPVVSQNNVSGKNAVPGVGICKLSGALVPVPLVSLCFSALPFYFMSLHLNMLLGSRHIFLAPGRKPTGPFTSGPVGVGSEKPHPVKNWNVDAASNDEVNHSNAAIPHEQVVPVARNFALASRMRFHVHRKKRSSLRSLRAPRSSLSGSTRNFLSGAPNFGLEMNSADKGVSQQHSLTLPDLPIKKMESYMQKSSVDRIKDLKAILEEILSVPGVRVVPQYNDGHGTFRRPDQYIKTLGNEVERLLISENANYDMDSADEEWLKGINSGFPDGENDDFSHVSQDTFEKIIQALEIAAYNDPHNAFVSKRAVRHCSHLADKDIVAAVFKYWAKKAKKKKKKEKYHLLRVFQDHPPKDQRSDKRRPSRRKGRNSGRGKPEYYLSAGTAEQELRRAEEDVVYRTKILESAVEKATYLRKRAQMLMENADLASYKVVMTLRLAQAIQEYE